MFNIVKRDGRIEEFSKEKLYGGIKACYDSFGQKVPDTLIESVISTVEKKYDGKEASVDQIQDVIVKEIRNLDNKVANAYKAYRRKRTKVRDLQTNANYYKTIMQLVNGEINDTTNENANKDAKQLFTMRDLIAGETCKKLYKDNIMSPRLLEMHDKGMVHIHDLDYRLMKGITNCCLANLKDIFEKGTVLNGKFIKTPKSLRTAATIATQVIAAIGSSQYGGISVTLAHLAPFVKVSRDKITEKLKGLGIYTEEAVESMLKDEIRDAIQTFNYQLNSMTTSCGQSPFITVFLYINEDMEYQKENVLLIKEMLEQRIAGMESPSGYNINPTFPKLIYVLDENNITEDSEYFWLTQLAAKCTCKRMVPDYISAKKMKEYKDGRVFPSMGCRSFLHVWKDENGNYKEYGRLNIGVMSINLPYLALESSTIDEFYTKLDETIDFLSSEQNKVYHTIAETDVDAAPILWKYGVFDRKDETAKIGDVIKNGYCSASIGYMGLAECVYRFGYEYVSEEGHAFGIEIMKRINDRIAINKQKYNLALSLYGTPAESLTTKFAKALKRFPEIKHVNDRDYITNSYHIPVEYEIDGFSKIDFESDFQRYSPGGAISYIEVPDVNHNPEAVISILKHIYEKMMYCEINTTSCDVCYNCGYEGEIELNENGDLRCPNCGCTDKTKLYAIRRMCGYLGSISNGVTKGRASDIINRVKHF